MNRKKREWIKKNWVSIILHIMPFIIYITVVFIMLDTWGILLSNDDMLKNIFASVTIFGGLIFITTAMIYIDIWASGFEKYKEDYKKCIGE